MSSAAQPGAGAAFPRAITILGTGTEGYGIRRCLIDMAAGLGERRIAVRFVLQTGSGPLADLLQSRDWPVKTVSDRPPAAVSGRSIGKAWSLVARAAGQRRAAAVLAAEVERTGSEAILLCSPLETLAAAIAARKTGRSAFWMMPNEISDYPLDINRRIYRAMFRHGNLVPLANSHFTDASLGPGDFRRRVCHLGIDPAEFDPTAPVRLSRAALGLPEDAVVIGLFARMVENKGQLQMIRAIGALGEEAQGLHLLLCGGPEGTSYIEVLQREARALGIAERVHLLGEQREMPDFYRLCDIVGSVGLVPEGFGLSVIEGMMLAKPVLAHRAGGPSETVIDGETGWLIGAPDLASFVAGLRRALADRPRWSELGAAARRHALANFTAGQMVERVLTAMRDLR